MNITAEQNRQNRIKAKISLNIPLNSRERSYYLLFMATAEQTAEYIRNEKIRGK